MAIGGTCSCFQYLFGVEVLPALRVELAEERHDAAVVDEVDEGVADVALVLEVYRQVEEVVRAAVRGVDLLQQHRLRVLVGDVADHDRRAFVQPLGHLRHSTRSESIRRERHETSKRTTVNVQNLTAKNEHNLLLQGGKARRAHHNKMRKKLESNKSISASAITRHLTTTTATSSHHSATREDRTHLLKVEGELVAAAAVTLGAGRMGRRHQYLGRAVAAGAHHPRPAAATPTAATANQPALVQRHLPGSVLVPEPPGTAGAPPGHAARGRTAAHAAAAAAAASGGRRERQRRRRPHRRRRGAGVVTVAGVVPPWGGVHEVAVRAAGGRRGPVRSRGS